MRALMVISSLLAACAAGPAPPSEPAPAQSELRAAWQAYSAYCGLCRNGSPCCLTEADFAPERWSKQSGPYLRALRDYYDCEYAESAKDESLGMNAPPDSPNGNWGTMSNFARNCAPHACQNHQATLVSELDRALATPRAHPPGALVACAAN
jgi:hypothetical protein